MFKNLDIKSIYNTKDDDISSDFYIPLLKNAVRYDRISAYFTSTALSRYAEGLENFSTRGSKYRLIISHNVSRDDLQQIKKGYEYREKLINRILEDFEKEMTLKELKNISNLAYYISNGCIDIRIAFMENGILHDKCGIFYDIRGNIVCFRGSNNETLAAIDYNYECFTVTCNWLKDSQGFYNEIIHKTINDFERMWNNKIACMHVMEANIAMKNKILHFNKGEVVYDSVMLMENALILDYRIRLRLIVNIGIDSFIRSSLYKIRLSRHVCYIENNIIYFKESLSYREYVIIEEKIRRYSGKKGISFHTTECYKEYIEQKNYYIEERYRVGTDIKKKDEKILGRFEEFSLVIESQMKRKLRAKQIWDSFFMCSMKRCGNFSVPGSGKTSSVLGVYAFLNYKKGFNKIIMIGPKNAFNSWREEFIKCFGKNLQLNDFSIHDKTITTVEEKKKFLKFNSSGVNLFLFNYHSLSNYKEEIKNLIDSKSLLVFDEVHQIKKIDGVYSNVALDISNNSKYTIVLTGTPIPNSYCDLYNALNILYKDEYKDFFGFSINSLKEPNQEMVERINKRILPFFCRTTKRELGVPLTNKDVFLEVNASTNNNRLCELLLKEYKSNKLALYIRILQLESNPSMLLNNIDCQEYYDILGDEDLNLSIINSDYSGEFEDLIQENELTNKTIECIKMVEKLCYENKKVIIWCIFKESINNLNAIISDLGIDCGMIFGDIEYSERDRIIKEFKNNDLQVLITNPHTLAESVSLHEVCHDAIYYEYSFNLVHLLQSKDRIHRLGLEKNQYTQYYFGKTNYIVNNRNFSLDDKIYKRLCEKENTMIEAIENNRLENVTSTLEDLEIVFKEMGI